MKKSPWIYVIFYYQKGKIVAAHTISTYNIGIDRLVRNAAAEHNVEYDDYIPSFIHA